MLTKTVVLSDPHEAHPKSLDFMGTSYPDNTDVYPTFLSDTEAEVRSRQDPQNL